MDGLQKSILLWRDWRCMGGREKNTMTVQFNITETPGYGTYLDDAAGMPYGKTSEAISAWQEFFGYKPCLFKDGKVVGYLNPNDYTKFENGTSADITSGNAGDVMVEFPRRGIKISKSGTTVTVSMTKEDNVNGYSYKAHQRGSTNKDYFYVGAYLGYMGSETKLRSLSGKTPEHTYLKTFRSYAANLGSGYMEFAYYQFLYIQCMYLLQYKGNLDSQTVHGYGFGSGNVDETGKANTYGVMHGTDGRWSDIDHIKLFGIEDFWGNFYCLLDGYYVTDDYHVLTTTDGFNESGSGYIDHGTITTSTMNGKSIIDVIGSNELGFTPISFTSTISVYFCSSGGIWNHSTPVVGGGKGGGAGSGIFQFTVSCGAFSSVDIGWGGRLAYL